MNDGYEPNEGQDTDLDDNDFLESEADAILDGAPDETLDGPGFDAATAIREAAEAEIGALNDKILRLAAELENTRRRADREKSDASRYAIASFARDLLTVADNFERALEHAPKDDAAEAAGVKGLIAGVQMTEKELIKTLERHGVQRVDPIGEKFDPNLHQAVAQAPAAGIPVGHVAQTAQMGFVLGDRVLRAAMVIISTGEPAPEKDGGDDSDGEAPGTHVDTKA